MALFSVKDFVVVGKWNFSIENVQGYFFLNNITDIISGWRLRKESIWIHGFLGHSRALINKLYAIYAVRWGGLQRVLLCCGSGN